MQFRIKPRPSGPGHLVRNSRRRRAGWRRSCAARIRKFRHLDSLDGPGPPEAWLDGLLPYALKSGDIAGGVVAVVKDGNILLQKGYGFS